MKYQVGDILKYPGNGITWQVLQVEDTGLEVKLLDKGLLDKGGSNHPYKLGAVHSYPIVEWKNFKLISFNSYLRRL